MKERMDSAVMSWISWLAQYDKTDTDVQEEVKETLILQISDFGVHDGLFSLAWFNHRQH